MLTRDRLDRPVDVARDHALGPAGAELTLVEYGSYACPHCRAANERIDEWVGGGFDGLSAAQVLLWRSIVVEERINVALSPWKESNGY